MGAQLTIDRQELSAIVDRALAGFETERAPIKVATGPVKTFALEANAGHDAIEMLHEVAAHRELRVHQTGDPHLHVLASEDVTFFADLLNPRFWLLHTTSTSASSWRVIRRWLRDRHEVDACWLPVNMLQRIGQGNRWFKTDFRGNELLPREGIKDRRLRLQLEGEDASELLQRIQSMEEYRTAAALSAVGSHLVDRSFGEMDEIANHNGYFVGRGNSFDLHVDYVSRVISEYESLVRSVEEHQRLHWRSAEDSSCSLDGDLFTITLGRPILDLQRFVKGLFSAREPFRLWAVPDIVSNGFATAEVVDLHIGESFSMDITRDHLRLYLSNHVCGNTALRILANIQHCYDATASAPFLQRHRTAA